MSLSKDLYERGYVEKLEYTLPLLDVGTRFTYHFGRQKNMQGTWEIVGNDNPRFYLCKRVLKNGSLTKSNSLENLRNFYESDVYRALKET